MVVHAHGAIWKERTFNIRRKRNAQEILGFLKAVMEPTEVAIIHCPGHRKTNGLISQGNNKADQVAKLVAQTKIPVSLVAALIPDIDLKVVQHEYSLEDLERAEEWGHSTDQKYRWIINKWNHSDPKTADGGNSQLLSTGAPIMDGR